MASTDVVVRVESVWTTDVVGSDTRWQRAAPHGHAFKLAARCTSVENALLDLFCAQDRLLLKTIRSTTWRRN